MKQINFIRIISILIIPVLLLSGCAGTPSGNMPITDTDSDVSVNEFSAGSTIIYPSEINKSIARAVNMLSEKIKTLTGKAPFCTPYSGGKLPVGCICLGNLSESETLSDSLPKSSYRIKAEDRIIHITASDDILYYYAAEQLLSLAKTTEEGLMFESGLDYASKSFESYAFIKDGRCDYRIVYESGSSDAFEAAKQLSDNIKSTTGFTLALASDTSASDGEGKEILIGNTNRMPFDSGIAYSDFRLSYVNATKNISISGRLADGCKYLADCIEETAKASGELLEVIFGDHTAGNLKRIPVYSGGTLRGVADSRMDSYFALIEKTNSNEYAEYVSALCGSGYSVFSERIVNSNIFTVCKNEDTVVAVTYISGTSSVRIAAEPLSCTSLPKTEPDNYQNVTSPQLTQLGGCEAYIIRLCDGRFIIIDGGLDTNADILLEQLLAQNTLSGKPIIAAWLLSHAHSDHVDCFIEFSKKYADKIVLQNLIMNNPGYKIIMDSKEDNGTCPSAMLTRIKSIESLCEKYGAKIIIAHAGQQFFLADAVIDMLYTQEDHYPTSMTVTNSSTLVFSFTLSGQKIMFLNDAYIDTMRILYNMYGKTLKSDIVQVAHHGYNGGLASTYREIGAETAIWTNGYDTVLAENLFATKDNSYVAASVRENLMPADSDDIMILSLPYTIASAPAYVRIP